MTIILFGYPRTGKTTLFNLLTGAKIEIKAYEEGRQEPNIRALSIPDPRLDQLSSLYPEKSKVEASVEIVDLVGISYGEVKNSTFLSHLRKADGLVHVVRAFLNPLVLSPKGKISPEADIRFMEDELILADLLMVGARLEKLDKDLKKMKDPEGEKEKEILEKLKPRLEEGGGLRDLVLTPIEEKLLRSFAFLSRKPLLHMINLDENDAGRLERVEELFPLGPKAAEVLGFCGKIENEILELNDDEKTLFLSEYNLKEPSAARFFRDVFRFLDVITFFTIGKDEVRAWTVRQNATALMAAGVIHSDIEKGFIRAEVISWNDLRGYGSLQKAKDAGAVRLEGKDYEVRDGDVIYFRFSQ